MEAAEKNSDESEIANNMTSDKKVMQYSQAIKNIIWSRSTSDLGQIAVIGDYRFTIYNVYDDANGNVDLYMCWDNDYRFKRNLRTMGDITALDFDDKCLTFASATQMGWICTWNVNDQQLLTKFQIMNPNFKNISDSINMLRDINQEKCILSYSFKSQILY